MCITIAWLLTKKWRGIGADGRRRAAAKKAGLFSRRANLQQFFARRQYFFVNRRLEA